MRYESVHDRQLAGISILAMLTPNGVVCDHVLLLPPHIFDVLICKKNTSKSRYVLGRLYITNV
jgi:hypothetical protein